jgi:hypothetical protein
VKRRIKFKVVTWEQCFAGHLYWLLCFKNGLELYTDKNMCIWDNTLSNFYVLPSIHHITALSTIITGHQWIQPPIQFIQFTTSNPNFLKSVLVLSSNTGRSCFMWFLFAWFCFNLSENVYKFSNLHDNFYFNVIWHKWHATILGTIWFGIGNPCPHLSCVGG